MVPSRMPIGAAIPAWMARALPLLLLGIGLPAQSQFAVDDDTFDPNTGMSRDLGPWRYSSEDDARFADPALDDRGWTQVDAVLEHVPDDFRGLAWLRCELDVSAKYADRPLVLWPMPIGAVEIYVDGELLYELGDVELARAGRAISVSLAPEHPLPLRFDGPGRHLIAVRFGSARARWTGRVGFSDNVSIVLGLPQSEDVARTWRRRRMIGPMLLAGAALVLTLLHLLLYLFHRSRRENLFYALVTASMCGIAVGSSQVSQATTFTSLLVYHLVFKLSVLLVILALLRFYYAVWLDRVPRHYWAIVAVGVVLAALSHDLPVSAVYIFATVGLVEATRVLALGLRRGVRNAWLIGVGGGVFSVLVVVEMLSEMMGVPPLLPLAYLYGFLALMVSMSAYLARDIGAANAELSLLRELEVAHRDLRATQAKLVQSEKMAALGQLVAGVAHEVNTPVGAIASVSDSIKRALAKLRSGLAERDADYENVRELSRPLRALDDAARVIESGSARIGEIVKRLRRFARLDEAERQRADLHEGLDDTLLLLQHELKHGVEVVKHYGPLPPISCFPSQLNQVFLNLLVNAVQAMGGKGTIEITTRALGDRVEVEFRDDGPGIAPEHLSRVFDPGFTTKGVGVGTGLGLSICYQIVEAHRGEIRAASEPGKGATFTVALPVEAPAAGARETETGTGSRTR